MRSTPDFLEHDGCRLAYTQWGEGPPVVFIQGTGVHGGGWLPQVDALKDRFRCITFDNRGMGLSQPCGTSLSVEQMAGDTLAIMDACGIEAAHIVGHSLGGSVAQQLALTAHNRIRSLALLNSFARGADATRLTRDLLWLGIRSRIGPIRMRRRAFLKIIMPDEVLENSDCDAMEVEFASLFGHDLGVYPPVVMKQMSAMRNCDLTSRLAELKGLPTLVIGAAQDRIARPEMVRALANGIPGAKLVEFPNAGHALPIQLADEVNELLASHLEGSVV
ncbi:MAG: alpha/beta fold hydrolase [Luteolibacter sp.]|uniref:alpha/beta fold hydrolase n=1 Tax=Luteolibacter sp. TaxID=1962973 RepID=UPI003264E556